MQAAAVADQGLGQEPRIQPRVSHILWPLAAASQSEHYQIAGCKSRRELELLGIMWQVGISSCVLITTGIYIRHVTIHFPPSF